jgi:sugar lactone lactonase YvrE
VTVWETAFADDAELGERPLWDDRTGAVVWVDGYGGIVHRLAENGSHTALDVGAPLGAAGLRDGDGLVVARGDGVAFLGPDGAADRPEIAFDLAANVRFNDGACDPAGRFLIGTCAADGSIGKGALYSVRPDGGVEELLTGVTESNGLAWSADGGTMYYVDSGERCLRAYAYDVDSGRLGARRDVVVFPDDDGIPDGLIVDADDAVWVAMWEGACVRRYGPRGELLMQLETPVSRPTCAAFGGPELDRLYLATAWEGMDAEERAREPLAGSLLVARPGVRGVPAHRFGG